MTVAGVASNPAVFSAGTTPAIFSLSPNFGSVGTSVTVSGKNFGAIQGTSAIKFNGISATAAIWSDVSITAAVPTGATTGPVTVTVGSNVSNLMFFVVGSNPGITDISPSSAAVGVPVVINGKNFGSTQGTSTVTFNGTQAAPCGTCWSDTAITVVVPSGATSGNVVVTVGGTSSSNGLPFTVTPAITSLSFKQGPPKMGLVIRGTTFGTTQGTVSLSGTNMPIIPGTWTNTSISVQVPDGMSPGNFFITVQVGGVLSNGIGFTVLNPFTCGP